MNFQSQHPVPGNFPGRQGNAFRWRMIQHCPADTPAQKRLDGLEDLVRCDARTPLLNRGDDLDDVALADLVDAPITPGSQFSAKHLRGPASGPVLRHMLGDIIVLDAVE